MTGTLVDTNILVYIADGKDEKHPAAVKWLEHALSEEQSYFVCLQNLREFSSVCLGKKKISPADVIGWVNQFSAFFMVIEESQDDIIRAIQISEENSMHFWDANIAAAMESHSIDGIITENSSDFGKYGKAKVINIFGNASANN